MIAGPATRLEIVDAFLPRAAACGLGLHWKDLQIARSQTLIEMGRLEEARSAAQAVISGVGGIADTYADEDWPAVRHAVSTMQSAGGVVADHILAQLQREPIRTRSSPPKPARSRPAASEGTRTTASGNLHESALRVVERYQSEGLPFVLYFRTFHIDVLQGPFEYGPKLTENALRDSLPPEIEVLTIQDQRSTTYDLDDSRLQRKAPAFALDDENWPEVAQSLITLSDLIVSEPFMLGSGVRLELEMIYKASLWDRAVLVLPPLDCPLATIDNDSLIQLFPRCIWADSLHDNPLTQSPVIQDLLHRVRSIASLPVEQRRQLRSREARDKAYPVDLLPVAQHFESEAKSASVFGIADNRTRYYAFWQMFRAAGIRGVRYQQGDRSKHNRAELAYSQLEMSKIMLDHTMEGDKVILQGDPAEAELLLKSAYALLGDHPEDSVARHIQTQVEANWETLQKLQQVMQTNPAGFEIRRRYGPLMKRRASD